MNKINKPSPFPLPLGEGKKVSLRVNEVSEAISSFNNISGISIREDSRNSWFNPVYPYYPVNPVKFVFIYPDSLLLVRVSG